MLRANWEGKQRSGEFSGAVRVGVTWTGQGTDTRLTRRSEQEKSFFFLPGAQLAGRPAASVRTMLSNTELGEVPDPPEAWASYLPRRHCPRWRWGCPRWPAKRGSEREIPPYGTAEGLAGSHTGALLLSVSPAPPVASRGRTSHSSLDSLLFQLVALIKVGLPGSVCLYLWTTSFSARFPCPCYLPGSPP